MTDYTGYKQVDFLSEEELSAFYENKPDYNLCTNEYLTVSLNGKVVDKFRWTGQEYVSLDYKPVKNEDIGKIKPRNTEQEFAFDLIQNPSITIKALTGSFGTGKDFTMLSNAIEMLKKGRFKKLIWVRNNVEVKNTNPIGFLPDGANDKLKPFAMILADFLGDESALDMYLTQGKIEIQHLGFIRGRSYQDCLVYCTEAENLTKEHVQLLIGRIGEGSELWLNGDFKQTDMSVFDINNGLDKLIEKLKGNELFGTVRLTKCERSKTAALADLLDN